MLELETPVKVPYLQTTQLVAEMNKEYTLKQSITKIPGLILFGVNPNGWTAYQVPIKSKATIALNSKAKITHKADFNPNVIYIQALNERNAIRKVKRDFEEFIKRLEEKDEN